MLEKIKNKLLTGSGVVVYEQESNMAGFRCWIAISSISTDYIKNTPDEVLHLKVLDRSKISEDSDRIFSVRKIHVNSECIENDWDLGESDIVVDFFEINYSFSEVLIFLKKIGINTDLFSEAWNTEYPL